MTTEDRIDVIQWHVILLGVGKACPIVGLFCETGWVPLSLTIKFNILRFRNRLLKMEEGRLPLRYMLGELLWQEMECKTGRLRPKGLLDSIGDPAGRLTWDALARLTLQDWERDFNSIPDNSETGGWLKFYQILKASPSLEQYIEAGISLNKRRVITQLRTGCLPLEWN